MKMHINKIIMVLAVTSACSFGQDPYSPTPREDSEFGGGRQPSVELEDSFDFGKQRTIAVYSKEQPNSGNLRAYDTRFEIRLDTFITFTHRDPRYNTFNVYPTTTARNLKNRNIKHYLPERVALHTPSNNDMDNYKRSGFTCVGATVRMPYNYQYARVKGNNARSLNGWRD